MENLIIENGLLLAKMRLVYKGNLLLLERVLVDTGSGSTIISTDLAESVGIIAEEDDIIYRISGVGGHEFVFSKTVDTIMLGEIQTDNFSLEIGAMNYGFGLDGIIGLDLLKRFKAIINLEELSLTCN